MITVEGTENLGGAGLLDSDNFGGRLLAGWDIRVRMFRGVSECKLSGYQSVS